LKDGGARAIASFYSLIETAKANELEPFKYLRYLFEKFLYTKTSLGVFNLFPMNILKYEKIILFEYHGILGA
jgi:transposase